MRRLFTAVLLVGSVAVLAPTSAQAAQPSATTTAPRTTRRIYDPYRRDYHNWNRDEQRAYRAYLAERHRTYIAYRRQQLAERRAYWRWRHERAERRQALSSLVSVPLEGDAHQLLRVRLFQEMALKAAP